MDQDVKISDDQKEFLQKKRNAAKAKEKYNLRKQLDPEGFKNKLKIRYHNRMEKLKNDPQAYEEYKRKSREYHKKNKEKALVCSRKYEQTHKSDPDYLKRKRTNSRKAQKVKTARIRQMKEKIKELEYIEKMVCQLPEIPELI